MKKFREQYKTVDGYMLRYVYFIDKSCRKNLTVPEIPFSKIDELGAGMYKGKKVTQAERHEKLSEAQRMNENERAKFDSEQSKKPD